MSDPKDLHRMSLWTYIQLFQLGTLSNVLWNALGQIIVPSVLPVRNLGKPGGRVSQNSQKGQNALVPLRLFNIMVFVICIMGMWISQWAQWVDPRKKPVHWTLCQGSNRGQIIHGGIIVYYGIGSTHTRM
jgi:hypothetical protein